MLNAGANLVGFVHLGNGIYIKRPEESRRTGVSTSDMPSLILIFGWMGAAVPHLLKYTKVYEEIFPSSTQVLVRSEPALFWTSESTLRNNLAPLIDVLEAMGYIRPIGSEQTYSGDPPLRILTHCFSNGGATIVTTLHRMVASRNPVPAVSALVLDSNPGHGTLDAAQRAFGSSVQNPIAYYCIYLCLLVSYGIAWLKGDLIDGVPRFFVEMRRDLNDHNLLGWMSKKTPRLYLYSQKDDLIAAEAVEEHANQAGLSGFSDVTLEKFPDSPHVSHARVYPERYWTSIKELWRRAVA